MPGVIEAGDIGLVKFTKLCRIEKHLNSFKANQHSLSPATIMTKIMRTEGIYSLTGKHYLPISGCARKGRINEEERRKEKI